MERKMFAGIACRLPRSLWFACIAFLIATWGCSLPNVDVKLDPTAAGATGGAGAAGVGGAKPGKEPPPACPSGFATGCCACTADACRDEHDACLDNAECPALIRCLAECKETGTAAEGGGNAAANDLAELACSFDCFDAYPSARSERWRYQRCAAKQATCYESNHDGSARSPVPLDPQTVNACVHADADSSMEEQEGLEWLDCVHGQCEVPLEDCNGYCGHHVLCLLVAQSQEDWESCGGVLDNSEAQKFDKLRTCAFNSCGTTYVGG